MEDRTVLVFAVSRLSSRDMAVLCEEVSRSPLEASKHYRPYLLDEKIEVARCQAGDKTQWVTAGPYHSCRARGRVCQSSALVAPFDKTGRWSVSVLPQSRTLPPDERETCPYPNPLKASLWVFMGV